MCVFYVYVCVCVYVYVCVFMCVYVFVSWNLSSPSSNCSRCSTAVLDEGSFFSMVLNVFCVISLMSWPCSLPVVTSISGKCDAHDV